MKRAAKEYPAQSFSLEPTKLTKLMKAIHEKLDGGSQNRDRFLVHMKGDRKVEFNDVDDVLGLDNSRSRRITRLIIHSFKADERSETPSREIEVDFGAPIRTQDGSLKLGVTIEIAGETSTWISDALSDIEQQVERAWTRHVTPILILVSILVTLLFSVLFATVSTGASAGTASTLASSMWLKPSEIDGYASKLTGGRLLSEEDARDLVSRQLRNLSDAMKHEDKQTRPSMRTQLLTIAVPAVSVVALSVLIIILCYPSVVFLWGDEKDRQQWRDSAKRYLWAALIATTFVPIVSRLFVSGFFSGFIR